MILNAVVTPDRFTVTQPCSLALALVASETLNPGDAVEVQFPNSWSLVNGPTFTRELQSAEPAAAHHLSAVAQGCDAAFDISICPRQINFPGGQARHGRLITATLSRGTVPAGRTILIRYANTFAPYVAEVETVWVRVRGEAPEAAPTLTVLPGPHEILRIIAPSGVHPNEPFEVLIASLDRFDNASATTFENETLVLSDGTMAAVAMRFTGSIRVPAKLGKPGIYRFRMRDTVSNAVRVGNGCRGPFWGDLHIHSKLSCDAQGTDPYGYAHEVSGLDFAAAMDHWESLGEEGYRALEEWAEEADRPGRFAAILGDERNPRALTGHHNIYFRDLDSFRKYRAFPTQPGSEAGDGPRDKIGFGPPDREAGQLAGLDPKRVMLIPHHTGIAFHTLPKSGIGCAVRWDAWSDPGLRPVMEVYSHHGQCELYAPTHALAYECNRMRTRERRFNASVPGPYYAQDHWKAGRRIGVVCSSDEHSGQGGRRHGGIAAVFAGDLTREAVFDAIRGRRCYGTTGERILIELSVDGAPMGECIRRSRGSELRIELNVWGTELLSRVDILRFRFGVDDAFLPVLSDGPRPESMDAAYRIEDPLCGPCMYYARVTQEPLAWPGMAWTSPIWVDPE